MAEIRTKKQALRDAIVNKKASADEKVSRLPLGPIGFNSLKTVSGYIYEESKTELRFPRAVKTFDEMAYDPTVGAALNLFRLLITKAAATGKFEVRKDAPEEAQSAAKFLNWAKENMEGQTWKDFINEVCSMYKYGHHVSEKVYERSVGSEWFGKLKWRKLATRSVSSISKWEFNNRELAGVWQNPSFVGNSEQSGEVLIPRKKFMLFRYNPSNDNPEGNSPLKNCFYPWKYKQIVEEYELVGVTKDLGGIPVIGIDVEYLAKAARNPGGTEALVIEQQKRDAANLHAGEQSYIIRPVMYNDQGKELFTFNLQGVDGGGKQYNTDDIIRRKQNEILTVFLADVLKLGQDGSGSFALSDNKANLLVLAVESMMQDIANPINNDLIPQTLAMNGWKLSEEDMPKFVFDDLDDVDLETLGKFLQRVTAVGLITPDRGLENHLRESAFLPENAYDSPIPEEFKNTKQQSRAGDGMKTAGEGTSTGVADDPDTGNLDS